MEPLVCVILVNWKGWRDTLNCLESVFSNAYSKYQVIVCDNGSDDGSIEHIKAWAEGRLSAESGSACPKPIPYALYDIKDLEKGSLSCADSVSLAVIKIGKNLGFGAGSNVGIRYAKMREECDFIWCLNNDTVISADALVEMMKKMQGDSRLGAVGSVLHYMDRPQEVQAWGGGWVSLFAGRCGHHIAPTAPNKVHYITAASVLIRREALNQVGGFDERYFMYWEDTDLAFRLMQKGWKLGVAEKSKVFHKESASLGKKSVALEEYFNFSSVLFFKTHAKMPVLPISIATAGRILKRIILGDLARASAVWRGARKGVLHLAKPKTRSIEKR
ncbi:glycosyltransferase family 2 protein [Thermithiobacillus plumbiphilus]|uniref:Glycosyltransferase family 2 protein n=1 Tax=Thermithiobacillus plumbiphilus TaxID=1729899 RepID=A0ABU9D5Z5_9PROT